MGSLFDGRNRKVGVATLMLACLFAGGWVRSLRVKDEFTIRKSLGVTHHLISNRSRLAWKSVTIENPRSNQLIISFYFSIPADEDEFYRGQVVEWIWRWRCCGFEFGQFIGMGPRWREVLWIVPYWSIVIPLTLLSACLLLSKLRMTRAAGKSPSAPRFVNDFQIDLPK